MTDLKEYWIHPFPSSLGAQFIHTKQYNKQCFPLYQITQHNTITLHLNAIRYMAVSLESRNQASRWREGYRQHMVLKFIRQIRLTLGWSFGGKLKSFKCLHGFLGAQFQRTLLRAVYFKHKIQLQLALA